MIRTWALTVASVKGFLRDKKSFILLFALPIMLIGAIFGSFSSDGLQSVPIGVHGFNDIGEEQVIRDNLEFLQLQEFPNKNTCLQYLREHKVYACLSLHDPGPQIFTITYDNTREPVIWEVIERINLGFRLLRLQESLARTQQLLTDLQGLEGSSDSFATEISDYQTRLGEFRVQLRTAQTDLQSAEIELREAIREMEQSISETEYETDQSLDELRDARSDVLGALSTVSTTIYAAEQAGLDPAIVSELRGEVTDAHEEFEELYDDARGRLLNIQDRAQEGRVATSRGRERAYDISEAQSDLRKTDTELGVYQGEMANTQNQLQKDTQVLSQIASQNPEQLLQPFSVATYPAYIPQGPPTDEEITVQQGVSLISFQTLYPTVLLLIVAFLSLLSSAFLTLRHINSASMQRLRTIPGASFAEVVALFASAHTVLIIPISLLLILGHTLLRIPLLNYIGLLIPLMALTTSIFIMIGMMLAYFVRKESITLVIASFILIMLIFVSGVLLPIERMAPFTAFIAELTPGRIFILLFSRIVFHNTFVLNEQWILIGWMVLMIPGLALAKGWEVWRSRRD